MANKTTIPYGFLLAVIGIISILASSIFTMLPSPLQNSLSAFATFPGENGLIAFSAHPDEQTVLEIYVMNSDGTGQKRIDAEKGYGVLSSTPAWSPDGSKIAFTHYDSNSVQNINVMNHDGTNQIDLTRYPIGSAVSNIMGSWSPDGSKIVFTSSRVGHQSDIYVMNAADGGQVQRLTTSTAEDQYPDWSPDGSKIAFESNRDGVNFEVYVMDADGSDQTRLTNNNYYDGLVSWSPDGSKIAFTSGSENTNIYVVDSDGTGRMQLTSTGGDQPVWSPEGDKIAFRGNPESERDMDIYVVDAADGSNQVRLTGDNLIGEHVPDWGSLPPPEPDISPPIILVPDDITAEATGPDGAEVSFEVSAEDDVDGSVDVSCDYNSGDTFPIGETVVTCTAEDAAGNRAEESFTITVQDTTPPDVEITEAVDRRRNTEILNGGTTPIPYIEITFEATDAVGIDETECSLDGQAFTPCTSTVSYDRLSRTTHEVTVRATDEAGNIGEDEFSWTVGAPPSNIGSSGGMNR